LIQLVVFIACLGVAVPVSGEHECAAVGRASERLECVVGRGRADCANELACGGGPDLDITGDDTVTVLRACDGAAVGAPLDGVRIVGRDTGVRRLPGSRPSAGDDVPDDEGTGDYRDDSSGCRECGHPGWPVLRALAVQFAIWVPHRGGQVQCRDAARLDLYRFGPQVRAESVFQPGHSSSS
jgi:hypothetical protein